MSLTKITYKLFAIASVAVALTQSAFAFSLTGYDVATVKRYNNEIAGNGITVKEISNIANAKHVGRVFKINVEQAGYYHMACWTRSFSGNSVDVYVNQESFPQAQVEFNRSGWQAKDVATKSLAENNKLYLKAGENTIVFMDEGPAVPEVEFLRIGKNREEAFISEAAHLSRMQILKSSKGRSVENDTVVTPYEIQNAGTKEISLTLSSDPLYDYGYELEKEYKYTYRGWFYLTAGSQAKFESRNGSIGTVVYFFNTADPTSASWVGNYTSINVTVPTTGYYMGVVRSYWWNEEGTCDVYFNDQLQSSSAIVTGNLVARDMMNSGELNYFSAKPGSSNDTYIFLSTWRKQSPIAAYNDDYYGSGDFSWGLFSRIKHDLAGWWNVWNRSYIFAHAYSSYSNGTADFYLMNEHGTELLDPLYFPNLKSDDAIKSGVATPNWDYNCISWSGGITDDWVDPFSTLENFDLYYSNRYPGQTPRYAGAENFTRTGATPENCIVNLWAGGSYPYTGTFTHGSVKKPANNHAHGYDWESKCGRNIRVFHPKNALNGGGYGYVVYKYKSDGTYAQTSKMASMGINRSIATLDESVKLGLTKINEVEFTKDEKSKLTKYIAKIPPEIGNEFTAKFENWRKTWDEAPAKYSSHTRDYAKSSEYKLFVKFLTKHGKTVWPMLFNHFNKENLPIINVFEDLMYPHYRYIMDELKMKNQSDRYTADGTYVVYTLEGNWREFCKGVLQSEFE